MNEIKVVVMGKPGEGKSAVAEKIRVALEEAGVRVKVTDGDEDTRSRAAEMVLRLRSLVRNGLRVTVETQTTRV